MAERTFAIIKPDAVKARNVGKIIDMIEQNGFVILRMEKTKLTKEKAEEFYAVHKEKPFFNDDVPEKNNQNDVPEKRIQKSGTASRNTAAADSVLPAANA